MLGVPPAPNANNNSTSLETPLLGVLADEDAHENIPENEQVPSVSDIEAEIDELILWLRKQAIVPETFSDHNTLENLRLLFAIESSGWRTHLRWAAFDSILERTLQSLFLNKAALPFQPLSSEKNTYFSPRIFLHGRALSVHGRKTLKAVKASRSLLRSAEDTVFAITNTFFYGLLSYHLYQLLTTGRSNFSTLSAALFGISKNGLINLVQGLVRLQPLYLKLLTASAALPTAALVTHSLVTPLHAEDEHIQQQLVKAHPNTPQNIFLKFLYMELWQWVPGLSHSTHLQRLERLLRWEATLSLESQKAIYAMLENTAIQGDKRIQRTAMECLAKLAHSYHFRDLEKLQQINDNDSVNRLTYYLDVKAQSLQTLKTLSHFDVSQPHYQQLVRVLYARYLLWWLGQATPLWQHGVFASLKITKLTLQVLLLINLINVMRDALACPKQPGFQFGEGFAPWTAEYGVTCFTARIRLFRNLDTMENVEELMRELGNYHLDGLTTLDLSNKALTGNDVKLLLNAIAARGASLRDINLQSNAINSLSSEMFTSVKTLVYLYLGTNSISSMDNGTFVHLSQLQTLDLSHNQLSSISSETFANLPQLQLLYLSYNQFSTIPAGAFANLPQLQSLVLYSNRLSTIPSEGFASLPRLQLLDLGVNTLNSIPTGALANLPQLQSLVLSDNQLSSIPIGSFANLPLLQSLDLSYNQFSNIPTEAFANLSRLQFLILNVNQFNAIPSGAFSNLPLLQSLVLGENRLNTISSEAFVNLSYLQSLDLSFNQLSSLPTEAFTNLPQLQTLLFFGNHLSNIPTGAFVNLPRLQSLALGRNPLSSISPGAFANLTPLQTLYLDGNQLSVIPAGAFSNLPQLQSLALSENHLSTISSEAFVDLPLLQSLDLSGNRLSTVPYLAFANLSRLRTLNLGFNHLSTIPSGAFVNVPQLQSLNLGNNGFSTIFPEAFADLPRLRSLYLYQNQLSAIATGTFTNLPQLRTLDLSFNQISIIPSRTFANLPELQSLSLDSNRLSQIPTEAFVNLTQLQYLGLSSNQLTAIAADAFVQISIDRGNQLDERFGLSSQSPGLNDFALYNLTQCLPKGNYSLLLNGNKITAKGAEILAGVLPCTEIVSVDLSDNPTNFTTISHIAQLNQLRAMCESDRCQDVWPDEKCPTPDAHLEPSSSNSSATRRLLRTSSVPTGSLSRFFSQALTSTQTWMGQAIDVVCHALHSYSKDVVSSCPSYFDPKATGEIAANKPIKNYWAQQGLFAHRTPQDRLIGPGPMRGYLRP